MSQQIAIDVQANPAGAESGLGRIRSAADKTAESVSKIGKGAGEFADAMKRAEQASQRLSSAKRILERETGKPISDADAAKFTQNFDKMRNSRGLFSRRLKQFEGPEEWYLGHNKTFSRAQDAAAHRRNVIQVGLQGTNYAKENPPPEPTPEEPPVNPEPRGGGGFVSRAASSAIGFGKQFAALAGIGLGFGMVAKASEMNADEAVSTNTLRMRSGDLAASFENLRTQTRAATAGLGVTYVESSHLANELARVTGSLKGSALQSTLHSGMALSRAYGLDLASGVDFMGSMSRLGATDGSERQNKRLASMIADAISRSGYPAKADELIAAVSSFATSSAARTISDPNAMAYAGALSSLTQIGGKYLGPGGAAALIGQADSAARQGGALGGPSMNFSYRAIQRTFGKVDPWTAESIWEGGLFGTTRNLFGDGSKAHPYTPLGEAYHKNGWRTPRMSDETYLQILQREFRTEFAKQQNPQVLDAAKRMFGLKSMSEAAAFLQTDVTKLDPNKRQEILKKYQDAQDPGSAIRESVSRIDNELTRAGGGINNSLTGIRSAVEALAQALAPEQYRQLSRARDERSTNFKKKYEVDKKNEVGIEKLSRWMAGDADDLAKKESKYFDRSLKSGHPKSLDDLIGYPGEIRRQFFPRDYERAMSARQQLEKHMRDMGYGPDGEPLKQRVTRGLPHKAGANKYAENPAVELFLQQYAGKMPGGLNRITAENDEFHKHLKYHSFHKDGLAADFTLKDANKSDDAASYLRSAAKRIGADVKVINEYKNPSRKATGGHLHLQFNSRDAANKFMTRFTPSVRTALPKVIDKYPVPHAAKPKVRYTEIPEGHRATQRHEFHHRITPEPATVHIKDERTGQHVASVTVPFTPSGPTGSRGFSGGAFNTDF